MKHDKEVVVDILKQYLDLSIEFINEVVVSKLEGFMPEHLRTELASRMLAAADNTSKERMALLQRYLNEDMSFTELVRISNEDALKASVNGQVIAQQFIAEFDEEIADFQMKNADSIAERLKDLGMPVPDVKVVEIDGGQS